MTKVTTIFGGSNSIKISEIHGNNITKDGQEVGNEHILLEVLKFLVNGLI